MSQSKIRQFRLSKGWTQEQLADAIGASPRTVEAWDQGKKNPDRRYLKALKSLGFKEGGIDE